MSTILILISLIIIFIGAVMIYKPDAIPGMVKLYADELGFQVLASVGRVLLGIALLVYASHSNLPVVLLILGTLAVISGVVFGAMSPQKFSDFVRSMLAKVTEFGRIPGAVVTGVGLLLFYALM